MIIIVNPKSDISLYRQVMTQIEGLIASGKLRAGDRVPPVRELAVDIRINPNTVARAYRELDRLGVLETRGALGSFVAAGQSASAPEEREQELRERLREVLAAAVSRGIDEDHARRAFGELAEEAYGESGERAAGRRAAS